MNASPNQRKAYSPSSLDTGRIACSFVIGALVGNVINPDRFERRGRGELSRLYFEILGPQLQVVAVRIEREGALPLVVMRIAAAHTNHQPALFQCSLNRSEIPRLDGQPEMVDERRRNRRRILYAD